MANRIAFSMCSNPRAAIYSTASEIPAGHACCTGGGSNAERHDRALSAHPRLTDLTNSRLIDKAYGNYVPIHVTGTGPQLRLFFPPRT
ncbi:hypothetical protein GCM10009850_041790 [Nonomuraea monospora]|uniref:Uncharacterized protein n=1 Tax=Nonomuraea monospora TaxID=568818 RepID=A0ABN3CH50_9ACTN